MRSTSLYLCTCCGWYGVGEEPAPPNTNHDCPVCCEHRTCVPVDQLREWLAVAEADDDPPEVE